MAQRTLRTHARVNYAEEKVETQFAFGAQNKTTKKRKEAATAASQGPVQKKSKTRGARKAVPSPTEDEAEPIQKRSRTKSARKAVPSPTEDEAEPMQERSRIKSPKNAQSSPTEDEAVPRRKGPRTRSARKAWPSPPKPVVPKLVSRGVQTNPRPDAADTERDTIYKLPTEVRLNIYERLTVENPVLKDIPGFKWGLLKGTRFAMWQAHIVGRLGTIGNRHVLKEAETVLNTKDRRLDPVIWIAWTSLLYLPRLLQMITEAFKLDQRYRNAHTTESKQKRKQETKTETDWERIQRLWDVIIDIPVHEYLYPEPGWHTNLYARMRKDIEHLPYLKSEDFGLKGLPFGYDKHDIAAIFAVTPVSTFEVKLLKQFLASTLARLRRPQNKPAVLEVRVILVGPAEDIWRTRESQHLYAYFKAFSSEDLVIKFTVLSRTVWGVPGGKPENFDAEHKDALERIGEADSKDFIVEYDETTERLAIRVLYNG